MIETKSTGPRILSGLLALTVIFMLEMLKRTDGKNLIISTLSANLGRTFDQLKKGLYLPYDDELSQLGFNKLPEELNNMGNVTLELANKIYLAEGLKLKPKFKKLTKESFKSETEEFNVHQPEKAAKDVNTWLKDKTNNKIDKILSKKDINKDTAMILLNAVILLNAEWAYKFDVKDTTDRIFHLIDGRQKNVPTMAIHNMRRDVHFDYGSVTDLQALYIRLPYKNAYLEMLIVLPYEVDGIYRVIDNLEYLEDSTRLKPDHFPAMLYLPKFKVESTIDLKRPLQRLGMTDMFGVEANFAGITKRPLIVNKVLQKAFIEVNEGGTEAAAVTKLGGYYCSGVYPLKVNRPFVFQIISTKKKLTLFTGAMYEP